MDNKIGKYITLNNLKRKKKKTNSYLKRNAKNAKK
jgi:hypothetical protein